MKTIKINVYEYSELNEKAKEKALNDYREFNQMDFLEEDLLNILEEKLKEKGFKFENLKIGYSLNYCQGDGFNFVGDLEKDKISFNIRKISHHYEHSNTTEISINQFNYKSYEGLNTSERKKADSLLKDFEVLYHSLCKEMEKEGYKIIEFENSEENIKDYFDSNEYTFRSNGTIENI